MRLPDFIIIGAQKAGTTWLAQRLNDNPEVFMPKPFETQFFNIASNYEKGLSWYARLFEPAQSQKLIGEKTPDYLRGSDEPAGSRENTAERIYRALPHVRLIVILRNPIDRALSAFNHQVRARRLSPWLTFNSLATDFLDQGRDPFDIFRDGYYAEQLMRYRKTFNPEQMLILTFEEDLVEEPVNTIERVYDFLGLTGEVRLANAFSGHENRGLHSRLARLMNYYMPSLYLAASAMDRVLSIRSSDGLNPSTRQRIRKHYEPYNRSLYQLMGKEIDSWER